MPKLSIIVPVYNVENYLNRCVDSIRCQLFSNWEMILVDDGSSDNSSQICDDYALSDNRIKVIHKDNGGLASARNAGLKAADGEYIGFVDSDDTIRDDMYSRLIEIADKEKPDFVMADYNRVFSDGSFCLKTLSIRGGLYRKKDIQNDIYPSLIMASSIDYGPLLSVCQCLYQKSFLSKNHLFFNNDIRWSEDNLFSAKAGYCADSFYYLKGEGLYNYFQNQGTITTSYKKGAWHVYSKMNVLLREFFSNAKEYDFSQQLKWHLIYYACVCVSQTTSLSEEEGRREIKQILCARQLQNSFKNVDLTGVDNKLKMQWFLMKHKQIELLNRLLRHRKGC